MTIRQRAYIENGLSGRVLGASMVRAYVRAILRRDPTLEELRELEIPEPMFYGNQRLYFRTIPAMVDLTPDMEFDRQIDDCQAGLLPIAVPRG